jgi:hypothetical protein
VVSLRNLIHSRLARNGDVLALASLGFRDARERLGSVSSISRIFLVELTISMWPPEDVSLILISLKTWMNYEPASPANLAGTSSDMTDRTHRIPTKSAYHHLGK